MKDELGERMKTYYEDRYRMFIPRRTYIVIRIDGKAFHTYTRGLVRPFDEALIKDMNDTAKYICANIQGAKLAYVQSDEISIVITDFENQNTAAWFDNNIQKMASISSSLATSKFNQLRVKRFLTELSNIPIPDDIDKVKFAQFDARVFAIPSQREEVINYLIWRQQDATRNSISAVAQSLYSPKELNKQSTDKMQELIFQKGQNWNDYPVGQKRGRLILKSFELTPSTKANYDRAKDKAGWVLCGDPENPTYQITRSVWSTIDPPIFTAGKDFLRSIIPSVEFRQ